MFSQDETPAERMVSWGLAIVIAILFLPAIAFVVGTGLLSIGLGISNATGLPIALSWALVVIYLGVGITTIIRVRASRIRRSH